MKSKTATRMLWVTALVPVVPSWQASSRSCAAKRTGIAKAANKVIVVMQVSLLDFMLSPFRFSIGVALTQPGCMWP